MIYALSCKLLGLVSTTRLPPSPSFYNQSGLHSRYVTYNAFISLNSCREERLILQVPTDKHPNFNKTEFRNSRTISLCSISTMTTFAKKAFNAAVYSQARPTYPSELFEHIFSFHRQGSHQARWERAVDLGCGTGGFDFLVRCFTCIH